MFRIEFSDSEAFNVGFNDQDNMSVKFDSVISNAHYHGGYEFVSSGETQTIRTAGLVLEEDIIIDPIPENYGLITWDGSVITVS